MGAGASAVEGQERFTADEVRALVGEEQFDRARFDTIAVDGAVSAAQLTEALRGAVAIARIPSASLGDDAAHDAMDATVVEGFCPMDAEEADADDAVDAEALEGNDAPEAADQGGNGEVTVIYNLYREAFPVEGGKLSPASVNEAYCIQDVMPGSTLKLSTFSTSARQADPDAFVFVDEESDGMFSGLVPGQSYHLFVIQDATQEAKDQESTQARLAQDIEASKDEGKPRVEGCSCLEGNPCVDQYICEDWHNRNAVATAHGWKGA